MSDALLEILEGHERGEKFAVCVTEVDEGLAREWVRLRISPVRFIPTIFDGDWADVNQHPAPGEFKILCVVTGNDGVSRAITRQGRYLYAYPWIGLGSGDAAV